MFFTKAITVCSLGVVLLSSCAEASSSLHGVDASVMADTVVSNDVASSADVAQEDVSLPSAPPCNPNFTPIVLVHGFLASGDTWTKHVMRFMANGYCLSHLRAFDWNTLDQSTDWTNELNLFIDAVLVDTNSSAVHLVGHSAGAGLTYGYLESESAALKVDRYVYAGAGPQAQAAGPSGEVPTLYLWSKNDAIMQEIGPMPGADEVILEKADHYSVVSDEDSFIAIFKHLNENVDPEVTDAALGFKVEASGKALAFAENTPTPGTLVLQALDSTTGIAREDLEAVTLTADDSGAWGPVTVPNDAPLHIRMTPEDGTRSVNYFREPMLTSNPLVYLRTLPSGDGLASLLLSGLPFSDTHSILVVFSASRALNAANDSLKINGTEVLNEDTANAANTTIALFLYDVNEDETSNLTPNELFASFPFLAGLDMALEAQKSTISVVLNDRILNIPALPSDSDGVSVVVFD